MVLVDCDDGKLERIGMEEEKAPKLCDDCGSPGDGWRVKWERSGGK
jgi:hypothetical protein